MKKGFVWGLGLLLVLAFAGVFVLMAKTPEQTAPKVRKMDQLLDSLLSLHPMDYLLVADLSLHSGKYRLWLYDKDKKGLGSFPCLHGMGSGVVTATSFSNVPGSKQSSLGLYRMSKTSHHSPNFGRKYLLYGLDKTNSKALERQVVFHPYKYVANKETYPVPSVLSEGCPTVSEEVFDYVDKLIKNKNAYLYIVNGMP